MFLRTIFLIALLITTPVAAQDMLPGTDIPIGPPIAEPSLPGPQSIIGKTQGAFVSNGGFYGDIHAGPTDPTSGLIGSTIGYDFGQWGIEFTMNKVAIGRTRMTSSDIKVYYQIPMGPFTPYVSQALGYSWLNALGGAQDLTRTIGGGVKYKLNDNADLSFDYTYQIVGAHQIFSHGNSTYKIGLSVKF